MLKLRHLLGDPPVRHLVFAVAVGVVLYLASLQTEWRPFWSINNEEATAFSTGLMQLVYPVVALSPVLALRAPLSAAAVTSSPLVLSLMSENEWPFVVFVGLLAIAMVATWTSPRKAVAVASLSLALVATVSFGHSTMLVPYGAEITTSESAGGVDVDLLGIYAVVVGAALALAMWQTNEARAAGARAAVDQDRRQIAQDAAVLAERARLSRDLHDVVAHHVSLIAVRAETARYTHPGLTSEAHEILDDVAADARLALDELRGVLGILGRASEDSARSPQPSWQDIGALVERTRASGTDVHLGGGTGPDDVGAATGYVAYRVVQEALTNARRHAPGQPVHLHLANTGATVVITVRNDVVVGSSGAGIGRGLVGMRERVEAIGGRLTAGAADGVFVVEATLPGATHNG